MFVRALVGKYSELGIGKQIDQQAFVCSIEYFDAPTSNPIVHTIDADQIEPYILPEQTRVYHFNEAVDAWEIGRLIDDQGTTQFVRFPNGTDRLLNVTDVFVRWARPITDPTQFLGSKINETPRFANGRSGFIQSLINQRAATMGMSALASSAIELESHQVEVVRRVLQDPVQRYLLADEVGLGKTIEAGILIRQCILDGGDDTQVLIIVPDPLVPQWRAELSSKFFLGHCLDHSVHVLPLNEAGPIKRLLAGVDMLVIDEAHHLTGHRFTNHTGLFNEIAAAAPGIERILLLSATPALHNERGFLEMLHLLDPDTYDLTDHKGFRQRIENRKSLAEIVAGLTPDNALFLDTPLNQLRSLFPDDPLLQSYAGTLSAITDTMPTEDNPELVSAIDRLRAHLSEVYRLHRRILRHRRRNISGLTPERAGMLLVEYHSEDSAYLANVIEDWRFGETVAVADDEDDKTRADRISTFTQILEHTLQYPIDRNSLVDFPLQNTPPTGDAVRFEAIVRQIGNTKIFEDRFEALVCAIEPMLAPRQQFVVFCTTPATADAVATKLASRLKIRTDRHDPADDDWLGFSSDSTRTILVCDRRAEEGLNLQGGRKIVVHFDLPLNPNRVEQRLGRADRYGSGDAVRSIVLNCLDNPVEGAWIAYLDRGLRVFCRSIANLQYLVEETNRELGSTLFDGGTDALVDLTEISSGEEGLIEREMRNIDQQDSLDALVTPPTEMLDHLSDIDEDWEAIEKDAATWIEQTLQFKRLRERSSLETQAEIANSFRYRYSTSRQHTLIPLETFYSRCQSSVDHSPSAKLERMVRTVPMTFRRRTALSRQGRSIETRLLRYGDPFISGMWSITQSDDRGRSTAMWRFIPNYESTNVSDLFFRFDYVISANVSLAEIVLNNAGRLGSASAAAIVRRGDMALPPFQQTIWLDRELEPVDDLELLAHLNLAYRPEAVAQGGRDFNLNPRRWRKMGRLDIPELQHWNDLCGAARARSEAVLRAMPNFIQGVDEAARRASSFDSGQLSQLWTRAKRSANSTDMAEWELESNLSKQLLVGIMEPHVHPDAVLACFLSGNLAATAIVDDRA